MKIGKKMIARVLQVDKEKGYIDLSVKKLRDNEITEGTEKYNKSKQVNSILVTIQNEKNIGDLEKLY